VAAGAAINVETIMDSLNSDGSGALALEPLCQGAAHELLMRRYTVRTLNRYKRVWEQLADFARAQGLPALYSRDLALRFEDAFGPRDGEVFAEGQRWRRHLVFGIKILDEFARTGTISRFVVETTGLRVPAGMHKVLREYEQYARERRHLRPTSLAERMHKIAIFLDFLRSRGLESLDTLQAEHLSAFVQTRTTWKPRTVACASSSLKMFLQYLFMRGILPRDLSALIPTVRLASNAKVPSTWEPAQFEQLLAAVDRSSPKGKRDYAILLLAARLGLRVGDIKGLTLDHLHWSTSTIEIVQNKTGEPLVLPLIEEVGAALIDYLRAGRPPVEHRHLFTNLTPPFDPICQNDRLYRVVAYWRDLGRIKFKAPQRQGLHSLRHTLATRLLGAQTPFPVISAVLGHASPATTFIYAKADVETLRIAAIDPEEVCHGRAA
jgi:integrase